MKNFCLSTISASSFVKGQISCALTRACARDSVFLVGNLEIYGNITRFSVISYDVFQIGIGMTEQGIFDRLEHGSLSDAIGDVIIVLFLAYNEGRAEFCKVNICIIIAHEVFYVKSGWL